MRRTGLLGCWLRARCSWGARPRRLRATLGSQPFVLSSDSSLHGGTHALDSPALRSRRRVSARSSGRPLARAESGPRDLGPRCTSAGLEADPAAGDVPANWPIFAFVGGTGGLAATRATVRLVRVSDGVAVPLASPYVAPLATWLSARTTTFYHPICPGETATYDALPRGRADR